MAADIIETMTAPQIACPAPDPKPHGPGFAVPAGACDCHAHVIGPVRRYPFVPIRSYTPPDALLQDYLAVVGALGLTRTVLVQPSMYGTDNSVMLDAIRQLDRSGTGPEARAVAVVPPDVPDAELERLHARGVRGVRVNMVYAGGGLGLGSVHTIAERIRSFGWHIQILADVSRIAPEMVELGRLPVPVVFDHFGHLGAARGARDPGFLALVELARRGAAWVKLSGAYRLTQQHELPYDDVRPLADALITAAPDRLLWGTDWPHTVCPVAMPNDGDLLDLLQVWAPDETLRRRILVDNPSQLYFA